jgi:hypothetical protein
VWFIGTRKRTENLNSNNKSLNEEILARCLICDWARFSVEHHVDNLDVCTVHCVELYYICPAHAQYMLTIICLLLYCYMFQCLYSILMRFCIM